MKEKELSLSEREWETRSGVARVELESFRNYDSLGIDLAPGFNVLAGPNAQGKTNFLEALYLLATTRLLRGQRDAEAVKDGAPRARVFADLIDTGTRLGLTLERGIRKRATLNGASVPRPADLIGRLPAAAITAFDLEIVRGEPTARRDFLDLEQSALSPAYLRHLTLYKRALEQRNALLRDAREAHVPEVQYEPWEAQIAEHGARIRDSRRGYVGALSPEVTAAHARMGEGEAVSLRYVERDDAHDETWMLEALARSRQTDVARGGTSVGPHRDDLEILVDGREARLFGSGGQQRTAVIALKLGTLEYARGVLGTPPLLLLDDILSDLDARRRERLAEIVLERAGQAVLTCTEAEAAGERILKEARVFHVRAGVVSSA
ncbi:DNA replication/repair protein RecF [soil metagenome]